MYANYSVPEHDPLAGGARLTEELKKQVRPVEIVLILAGMYVNYSEWIKFEMDFTDELEKPMLGIRPWGADRVPLEVQSRVKEMVAWNTSSIVSAIRKWA